MQNSLINSISCRLPSRIADLQDSIHVIVELPNNWERYTEPALRTYLEEFDRKWNKTVESS